MFAFPRKGCTAPPRKHPEHVLTHESSMLAHENVVQSHPNGFESCKKIKPKKWFETELQTKSKIHLRNQQTKFLDPKISQPEFDFARCNHIRKDNMMRSTTMSANKIQNPFERTRNKITWIQNLPTWFWFYRMQPHPQRQNDKVNHNVCKQNPKSIWENKEQNSLNKKSPNLILILPDTATSAKTKWWSQPWSLQTKSKIPLREQGTKFLESTISQPDFDLTRCDHIQKDEMMKITIMSANKIQNPFERAKLPTWFWFCRKLPQCDEVNHKVWKRALQTTWVYRTQMVPTTNHIQKTIKNFAYYCTQQCVPPITRSLAYHHIACNLMSWKNITHANQFSGSTWQKMKPTILEWPNHSWNLGITLDEPAYKNPYEQPSTMVLFMIQDPKRK